MATIALTGTFWKAPGDVAWDSAPYTIRLVRPFAILGEAAHPRWSRSGAASAEGAISEALTVPDEGTAHFELVAPDGNIYTAHLGADDTPTVEAWMAAAYTTPTDISTTQSLIDAALATQTLGAHADVTVALAEDGDALVFDALTGMWHPGAGLGATDAEAIAAIAASAALGQPFTAHGLTLAPVDGYLWQADRASGDARVGRYALALSATDWAPGEPPDEVLLLGYNINPQGGAIVPAQGALALSIEGHYEPVEGIEYAEFQLRWMTPGGEYRRPLEFRLRKDGLEDIAALRGHIISFETPEGTQMLRLMPGQIWGGGVSIMDGGAANGVSISSVTSGRDLHVSGWRNVSLPGLSLVSEHNYAEFAFPAYFANTATVRGKLGITSLDGASGGRFLEDNGTLKWENLNSGVVTTIAP